MMSQNGYLETQVLGANRFEVVRLLYRGAIGWVNEARLRLSSGEIMLRSKAISKAIDFVSELSLSLNHEEGGTISRNLAEVYAYIQRLLLKAHAEQSASRLDEALALLSTLLEAWEGAFQQRDASTEPAPVQVEPTATPVQPASPYDSVTAVDSPARSWKL